MLASLIETCKRNDIDPQACLADVLAKIVNRHPTSRIDEFLPFAYIKKAPKRPWPENDAYHGVTPQQLFGWRRERASGPPLMGLRVPCSRA